jgi:hypothetical protein
MPGLANWLLDTVLLPPVVTAPPLPPLFGGPASCLETSYDQAYLLRLVERSYPQDYIFSIKNAPNGGYEVFQVAASVGARVSKAISELGCCAFLSTATGGVQAMGTIEFYRADATAGAYTISVGTVVRASKSGRDFRTTQAVSFTGIGDLGPLTAPIQAVATGYEYNVPGQVITAGAELLPGEIDTVWLLKTNFPLIDTALQVRQLVPTLGGKDACLDGLGDDVRIPRNNLEFDDVYRLRIYETPDTVSPEAITRGVNKFLTPLGASVCLREVGTMNLLGFFYDAGDSSDQLHPEYMYAYDMDFSLRESERYKVYLNIAEFRAFFLVGVPAIIAEDFGLTYDGASTDAFTMQNAYDQTAVNALNSAYDGQTYLQASLYKSIWDMVDAKRAAGVDFDLYIESHGCKDAASEPPLPT